MTITGFSCNRKLKLRKVEKKVKINSNYNQKCIFILIFKEISPLLLRNNFHFVMFHRNEAPRHSSKTTGIEATPFKCILSKSPDNFLVDFGFLKQFFKQ